MGYDKGDGVRQAEAGSGLSPSRTPSDRADGARPAHSDFATHGAAPWQLHFVPHPGLALAVVGSGL